MNFHLCKQYKSLIFSRWNYVKRDVVTVKGKTLNRVIVKRDSTKVEDRLAGTKERKTDRYQIVGSLNQTSITLL